MIMKLSLEINTQERNSIKELKKGSELTQET